MGALRVSAGSIIVSGSPRTHFCGREWVKRSNNFDRTSRTLPQSATAGELFGLRSAARVAAEDGC
jgi:hypothetical protein